ncbi:MAG: 50S ribosomal protein L23 [Candidatus Magasanikbacteria bacterium]|nr:50S ribosomal protein L23 [Candidatus Magasanikbacteria bacterium]
MGILKKVKDLVTDEKATEEVKAKKPRAKKAVAPVVVGEMVAHDEHEGHDHAHGDHAGHDHAAAAKSESNPIADAIAAGVASAKYIIAGLITEKGTHAAANDTYLFKVMPHASKPAIKQAIEKMHGVRVIKIRTCRYDGKKVRSGKIEGQRSNFKKAYVTVAKGQSITIHKGV